MLQFYISVLTDPLNTRHYCDFSLQCIWPALSLWYCQKNSQS